MSKKLLFVGLLILGIALLLIFHTRYPFVTPAVGPWSVGYQKSSNPLEIQKVNPENIITYEFIDSLLPEPIDYIADPFFIKEKDTFYIFVEIKGRGNANIALLTSPNGKKYNYQGIVLDEPFHLSYPQVFKHKGALYMLPETKGSNNVLLYKAANFPYSWSISDTLVKDISLKDPSLLLSEDLNLIVAVDDATKQYMFTADSLTGNWKELEKYRQNWGNETRPGGRFFNINKTWYLPLQNMSADYGTGISIYALKTNGQELDLALEKKLFLGPQPEIKWFNRGMHHLDIQQVDGEYYMVYDGDQHLDNKKEWQFKRTLKLNWIDFYNFLMR
ncbi:glucosamine inositolphosphorylceramide transferase family protein [Salinimicrobium sp. GXAS 041]|uniref:glucosamine inositolphosphorylceramide transferase family protein n=1 Tax=Salinimicrobium sp. GXAS 041 TaxID=3400806 RepID=UPI003C73EAD2